MAEGAPSGSSSPVAAAGQAFPAGDPRNGLYFQTLANLHLAYNTTLADDAQKLSNAESNSAYQKSLIAQKEPLAYKANERKANAGGILESGINAERRGNIATEYAGKRFSVQKALENERNADQLRNETAGKTLASGELTAALKTLAEKQTELGKNEPTTYGATPHNETTYGPAGAGGVVRAPTRRTTAR